MKLDAHTQIENLQRYFHLFFKKERKGWLKLLKFYNIYIPLGLFAIIGLAIYINPLPPKTAYLATGQDGSSYKGIAKNFQSFFNKHGINLELISTKGLAQGLQGLHDTQSEINASFLTVGFASAKDYPDLVSLGSVQYAPIWIFYRGPEVKTHDPFQYLANKNISIGPPGEATNSLFQKLREISSTKPGFAKTIQELPHKDGALALHEGKLDALFIVDSIQSKVVNELLQDPSIKVMNFTLADAYLKKLPFLQKLVIPKGSRNIEKIDPPEDITILATTTNLLVERDTHRAIQWAFLLAAKESNEISDSFFSSPGFFPKDIDRSFPLSPIAERFYKEGTPSLFHYAPIWIASLLDSMWVYILAFFALIYPAIKLIEGIRLYPSEGLMQKFFINVRILDEEVLKATSKQQIDEILLKLEDYEKDLYDIYLF